jgi:hypothetical protein
MNKRLVANVIGGILIAVALNGCSSPGTAASLYDPFGGSVGTLL